MRVQGWSTRMGRVGGGGGSRGKRFEMQRHDGPSMTILGIRGTGRSGRVLSRLGGSTCV